MGAGSILMLVAAGVLYGTVNEYNKSGTLYEETSQEYVSVNNANVTEEANAGMEGTDGIVDTLTVNTEDAWWNYASVNLEELKTKYPDVVGWILFENEDISYPILYSGDNAKYLRTTYTGEVARAGSIFLDGESTPDFSDPHVLIYGHNMRDLSMFGKLKYYKTDRDYYQNHQYFQIFTGDKVYRYQIFAYEDVEETSDVYYAYGANPSGLQEVIDEITSSSYCSSDIVATEDDHIVTLSTCTATDDKRLIVSAVRLDEHDYLQ